jgi:hypothetical protein
MACPTLQFMASAHAWVTTVSGNLAEGFTEPNKTSARPLPASMPPYGAHSTAAALLSSTSTPPALTTTKISFFATAETAVSSCLCNSGSVMLTRSPPSLLPGRFRPQYFVTRTGVTQVNLSQYGPIPRWKRLAHSSEAPRPTASTTTSAVFAAATNSWIANAASAEWNFELGSDTQSTCPVEPFS